MVAEGFRRLGASVEEQTGALEPDATAATRHRAIGRAYALFALDHTAYFRVMFELPGVAQMRGDGLCAHEERVEEAASWCQVVETVQQAMDEGSFTAGDAQNAAVIGWGLVHGLTSLYLSGHLMKTMQGRDAFIKLLDEAMSAMGRAWAPVETGDDRSS